MDESAELAMVTSASAASACRKNRAGGSSSWSSSARSMEKAPLLPQSLHALAAEVDDDGASTRHAFLPLSRSSSLAK